MSGSAGEPPLLTIIGGKITTYRHLAEEVLRRFAPLFPQARAAWTRGVPLPGGKFARDELARLATELAAANPALGEATSQRLARSYGTMAREIFARHNDTADLGLHFGAGLYERETRHLVKNEWAITADDVLWRRTKLGLRIGESGRRQLAEWLAAQLPSPQRVQACGGQSPSSERRRS